MALTPEEARGLTKKEQEIVSRNEAKIDAWLRQQFDGRQLWCGLEDVNHRVHAELTQRYEAAGWRVDWHSDQREGTLIGLTPRPQGQREGEGGQGAAEILEER